MNMACLGNSIYYVIPHTIISHLLVRTTDDDVHTSSCIIYKILRPEALSLTVEALSLTVAELEGSLLRETQNSSYFEVLSV